MEYPTDIYYRSCKCNKIDYYCYCDGEDILLNKLKEIGIYNLKHNVYTFALLNNHLDIAKWLLIYNS